MSLHSIPVIVTQGEFVCFWCHPNLAIIHFYYNYSTPFLDIKGLSDEFILSSRCYLVPQLSLLHTEQNRKNIRIHSSGIRFVLVFYTVHSFCLRNFDVLMKKQTNKNSTEGHQKPNKKKKPQQIHNLSSMPPGDFFFKSADVWSHKTFKRLRLLLDLRVCRAFCVPQREGRASVIVQK